MLRGTHRTPSTLLTLTATGALLLAGCADGDTDDQAAQPTEDATSAPSPDSSTSPDDADDADDASPTASPSTSRSQSPQPDATASPVRVDTPTLDAQCTIEPDAAEVESIRYAVPSGWQVEGRCDILDPELDSLPDEAQEVEAALFVDVLDAPYDEVLGEQEATRDTVTWVGARSNLQLARRTAVSTGEALRPEGRPSTTWYVDLDAGTDEQGGVLTLTASGYDDGTYALAQATVDRIAQTVAVRPPAEGPGSGPGTDGFAVLRLEGGGSPVAVTYDGTCFALRPGGPTHEATQELCDLDPTDGEVAARMLGEEMLVGHVSARAVMVQAPGADQPHALATPVEGGSLFALPVIGQPDELRVLGAGGAELATAEVG